MCMAVDELALEIRKLKAERNAVILAHYYQIEEIQEIADFKGDSFALSRQAASTDADVIVFCGVHFMAESAAILSPQKTVLLPDPSAGCPLADMITPAGLRAKKEEYPQAAVVSYVNSSAEIKAMSDICCTSSNAVRVVNSLPEKQIIFVPDYNLAHYVAAQTSKEIIPWEGHCITHYHITAEDVQKARELYPAGFITVHPECRPEVVALADHVGSTSAILKFARETSSRQVIVGTEMGTLYLLQKESPDKEFYFLTPDLVCRNMKKNDLQKVRQALEEMQPQITVPEEIRKAAYQALERMLQVS